MEKEQKRKVVFLVNHTWQQMDYRRYGIEILANRGFQPEVWDIGPLIVTDHNNAPHHRVSLPFLKHRVFFHEKYLFSEIAKLNEFSCFISVGSISNANMFIFRAITRQGIPFGISFLSVMPIDLARGRYLAYYYYYRLCRNPGDTIAAVLKRMKEMRPFPKYSKDDKEIKEEPIRPKFLLVAGSQWQKLLEHKNQSFRKFSGTVLDAHTYDYDAALMEKSSSRDVSTYGAQGDYAVFLDQSFPQHFAFTIMDKMGEQDERLRLCEKNIYYAELCRYFNHYEQQTGYNVVVALHPKALTPENQINFGGRQVIVNDTAKLVRESRCVMVHCTTAVSYAVIYRRPIISLTSRNYHREIRWEIRHISKKLGSQQIDISSNYRKKLVHANVNEQRYKEYFKNFIKNNELDNQSIWDGFCDFWTAV